jgi:RNA polymerase sigma-70 factor (ECF subfamily)
MERCSCHVFTPSASFLLRLSYNGRVSVAPISDLELARELLAGSAAAFERFVEVYHRKLFRYTFTMCGHREDAEEVAQETLLKVFESLDQLRDPARLKPWVFRIAKNACLMKRRKSVFAPQAELSLDELMPRKDGEGDGTRLEIADWSALPETLAIDAQLRGALEEAVRTLPETHRAVFLLRDVEDLSTEEAAEVLGVSEDLVKTRLHRARLMLRKQLDEHLRNGRKQ